MVILIVCGFCPHVYWECAMLISSNVQVVDYLLGCTMIARLYGERLQNKSILTQMFRSI